MPGEDRDRANEKGRDDDSPQEDGENSKDSPQQTPLLEWIAAIIGFVLVAGSIAVLLSEAITQQAAPPDIVVQVEEIVELETQFLVRFVAQNQGGQTAANVTIEGTLVQNGETLETATTSLDYVPDASTHSGGLYFQLDPGDYDLEVIATGYEEP